jgi:hypothetical protein
MRWITGEKVKVDRVACPWLLKKYGLTDPAVTGQNIRAFNFGYFLPIGRLSRLSFDYQFQNHPSFEDDAVNGRLQITWGVLLK